MDPSDARAWVQTSHCALRRGDYRLACSAVLRSAALKAGDARTVADVVSHLAAFNQGAVLIEYVQRLGRPEDLPIPLLLGIARQFSALNEQARALEYLDEAHRADPDYPPTLLSRAQVWMYLGRIPEAARDIEACLRRAPEIAQAQWLRSGLTRQSDSSNHVSELRGWLSKPWAKATDVAFLGFALHKELDDMGDVDGAWHVLEQACLAKRATFRYAREESRRLVDRLIECTSTGSMNGGIQSGGRTPIFIVGMHRSGTTLLEQLLDANPAVRGIGELYDFTHAMRYATDHYCEGMIDETLVERASGVDWAEVGRRYMEGLAWRLGKEPFFTDKLPSNFLNIGFICRALPQAKILHMVRDPLETCFSNLRELFSNANPYSYDQGELADYFHQYRRLMRHWHATHPGRILDVSYARLVANPETVMREVAAFCGLEYVETMNSTASSKRAVATASALQVRQGVHARELPKWVPYEKYLQPLIESLRTG